MTARGRSGARPTARRSRPARPDPQSRRLPRRGQRRAELRGTGWGAVAAAGSASPRAPGARAARRDPPPFPGPLCSARFLTALRSGFASAGFDVAFVDDDGGAAERRDPGRGDVAFERLDIWRRLCRGRRLGSGRLRRFRRWRRSSLPHWQRAPRFRPQRPERPVSPRWPRFAGASGFAASTCIGSAGCSAASFSGSAGRASGV